MTSLAFRAPNRGLALATGEGGDSVWEFNGERWTQNGSFPSNECHGGTILWAGKKDYWVIGYGWSRICRFNGETGQWDALSVSEVLPPRDFHEKLEGALMVRTLNEGGITSGACFAWNDCSFFGSYGTVLHWAGSRLSDAAPVAEPLQQGQIEAAAEREGPAGERLAFAVGATSGAGREPPLVTESPPAGRAPTQLYTFVGEALSPLEFNPPTKPLPGDPYQTNVIGVDLEPNGSGWVAGDPVGVHTARGEPAATAPSSTAGSARAEAKGFFQLAPLSPVSSAGSASGCEGPPGERFTYSPEKNANEPEASFLWSGIAVLATRDEALAGGEMWVARNNSGLGSKKDVGAPVIARAACNGETRVTTFPEPPGAETPGPADKNAAVTAIAGTGAPNDAWAATAYGTFPENTVTFQPPRLYRLTNGAPPEAAEGNDEELNRAAEEEEPQKEPIKYIEEPAPAPVVAVPTTVTKSRKVKLPPALYDVKAKLHTTISHGHVELQLYITFKLRRSVTVGAQALRNGRIVSTAPSRRFIRTAHIQTGLLILSLSRAHWPTKVKFVA